MPCTHAHTYTRAHTSAHERAHARAHSERETRAREQRGESESGGRRGARSRAERAGGGARRVPARIRSPGGAAPRCRAAARARAAWPQPGRVAWPRRCAARPAGSARNEGHAEAHGAGLGVRTRQPPLGPRPLRARPAPHLVQNGALLLRALRVVRVKVLRHGLGVLAALARERGLAPLGVRGQVAEQQLPRHHPVLGRDPRPARVAQRVQVDDRCAQQPRKLGAALRLLLEGRAERVLRGGHGRWAQIRARDRARRARPGSQGRAGAVAPLRLRARRARGWRAGRAHADGRVGGSAHLLDVPRHLSARG